MTAVDERSAVRRVQRPTAALPVLHLEPSIPTSGDWTVTIDGLVGAPRAYGLEGLRSLPADERVWDLHCVWGWSRPACRWCGIPVSVLLEAAAPLPNASFGVVRASGDAYGSCLSLDELRASLIAFALDGEPLTPDHGGPIRLVPPPTKWGYKGVKWVARVTLVERFTPGVWETLVGNPHGDIPPDRLDLEVE